MDDLISRQAAMDAFASLVPYVIDDAVTEAYVRGLSDGYSVICNLPSAQPEQKKGHWIHHEGIDDRYEDITCSVCHKSFTVDAKRTMDIGFIADDFEFCPHCGADMRGGEDE